MIFAFKHSEKGQKHHLFDDVDQPFSEEDLKNDEEKDLAMMEEEKMEKIEEQEEEEEGKKEVGSKKTKQPMNKKL